MTIAVDLAPNLARQVLLISLDRVLEDIICLLNVPKDGAVIVERRDSTRATPIYLQSQPLSHYSQLLGLDDRAVVGARGPVRRID